MNKRGDIVFEVETADGTRWTVESAHATQALAMERAQLLAKSGTCDGVRVSEDRGLNRPKVLFETACKRQEKPVTIASVDSVPLCKGYADLFGYPARRTLGRLLINYLDREGMIALELLCNLGHLRILKRNDTLWYQALRHLASVQARADGSDEKQRLDELERLANEACEQARDLPKMADRIALLDTQGVGAAIAGLQPPAQGVVLAAITSVSGDWNGKLARVVELAEREKSAEGIARLDEIAAEILNAKTAIRDLLGSQSDLAKALIALAELATGRAKFRDEKGPAARLNTLMGKKLLPQSRAVLLARVETGIKGVQPLTREGEQADAQAYGRLLTALIGLGGLEGTFGMAEAITHRQCMVGGRDGHDMNSAESVRAILRFLPNQAVRLGYLLALGSTAFGTRHAALLMNRLAAVLDEMKGLSDLLPAGATPAALAETLAEVRKNITASALPADIKNWIESRLTAIAANQTAAAACAPTAAPASFPPPQVAPNAAAAPIARPVTPPLNRPAAALPAAMQSSALRPTPTGAAQTAARAAAAAASQKTFPEGTLLFSQGDVGDEAYLVLSGTIEVFIAKDGKEVRLGLIERGAIVGEMSLVDDSPRMASARTLAETKVQVIPRDMFRRQLDRLQESDPVMRRLVGIFVQRLRTQADLAWYE